MKNKFTILLFILVSILASFSYANQNPDMIIQQRNIEFMNMMGQIEYDKRREAERQIQLQIQQQIQENGPAYDRWTVFVWDRDTGYWYGLGNMFLDPSRKSDKEAIKIVKKEFVRAFKEEDGIDVKATDHLIWDGVWRYFVVMGVNRKTGKWEAFARPHPMTEDNKNELLNKCKQTCDSCSIVWKN